MKIIDKLISTSGRRSIVVERKQIDPMIIKKEEKVLFGTDTIVIVIRRRIDNCNKKRENTFVLLENEWSFDP